MVTCILLIPGTIYIEREKALYILTLLNIMLKSTIVCNPLRNLYRLRASCVMYGIFTLILSLLFHHSLNPYSSRAPHTTVPTETHRCMITLHLHVEHLHLYILNSPSCDRSTLNQMPSPFIQHLWILRHRQNCCICSSSRAVLYPKSRTLRYTYNLHCEVSIDIKMRFSFKCYPIMCGLQQVTRYQSPQSFMAYMLQWTLCSESY